jgi:hypothetical protein
MKFETLLKKHHIKIKSDVKKICLDGLDIMEQTIDPIHDREHIENIFDHLDYLLTQAPKIKKSIAFDVLLMAICWHDAWKSGKNAKNPIYLIYHNLFEGLGSSKLFKKYTLKNVSNRKSAKSAAYAIRKHSMLQFLPTRTIEAKILMDLDTIELWNPKRLNKDPDSFFIYNRKIYKKATEMYYRYIARKTTYLNNLEELLDKEMKNVFDFFKSSKWTILK